MGEYIIKQQTLQSIFDSIRSRMYYDELLTMSDVIDMINNFEDCAVAEYMHRGIAHAGCETSEKIRAYAFYNCYDLISADFSSVTSINPNGFFGCSSLTTINFPSVKTIEYRSFYSCSSLTTVDFPLVTSIASSAFEGCSSMLTLILRSTALCTLGGTNAFTSTPIASGTGYIYVPAALIEEYKAATNWSTYANQFRAIEDYPDVCAATVE